MVFGCIPPSCTCHSASRSSLRAAGPHVVADVVLPASGACFEAEFPATPLATPGCVLNKKKTTLKCK